MAACQNVTILRSVISPVLVVGCPVLMEGTQNWQTESLSHSWKCHLAIPFGQLQNFLLLACEFELDQSECRSSQVRALRLRLAQAIAGVCHNRQQDRHKDISQRNSASF